MTPRSLTKAGATRLPAGHKETVDMLEKLRWQLLCLSVRLAKVGRHTGADTLHADLEELAQAAQALARVVQVTGREGKKLCPHFTAALQRRQTALREKREAPVPAAAAAAAFPQFARLPAELRGMVWAAAAQPLPCLHLFHLLAAARKPTLAEEKEGLTRMQGAHEGDQAGVLLLGDLGLWRACAESRRVVKRAHAQAHRRLLANSEASLCFRPHARVFKKFYVRQDFGCRPICTLDLMTHGRRLNRLNRAALTYTRVANSVHRRCKAIRLAEHALRKDPVPQTQTQTQTQEESEEAQQPPSAILQDLLRYLYALDGDLPQGAHDGPIPAAALGLFRKDLRLRHLLDFGF